jgi:ketosteroid isomerase-like protein
VRPIVARHITQIPGVESLTAGVHYSTRPVAEFRVVGKLQQDGLALTHGRWHIAGTHDDGGHVELTGRGTLVSRRQTDGRWLIALDDAMTPP